MIKVKGIQEKIVRIIHEVLIHHRIGTKTRYLLMIKTKIKGNRITHKQLQKDNKFQLSHLLLEMFLKIISSIHAKNSKNKNPSHRNNRNPNTSET